MRPRFNTLIASAIMAAFMAPAHALDVTEMSKEERAAFRAEVRAYLLENPEVIMEAVAVLEQRQTAQQAEDDISLIRGNADAIFSDGHSWVGGNPEGDVTVVEFMDYRCGYCRRASPEVTELVNSDGDIRFILKEFPILGEESMLSSRYAIAVRRARRATTPTRAAHRGPDGAERRKGSDPRGGACAETLRHAGGSDAVEIRARMHSDRVTSRGHRGRSRARLGADSAEFPGTPSFVLG